MNFFYIILAGVNNTYVVCFSVGKHMITDIVFKTKVLKFLRVHKALKVVNFFRESHKAPLTVLHHRPNHFENLSHRQSSTHYYGMPPPFFHNSRSRVGGDRHRFGNSPGASRADRKLGKHKGLTRKHLSEEGCRRRNVEMPMMDLHNHAIPMLSLTYSNKKKSSNSDEKRNDIRSFGR